MQRAPSRQTSATVRGPAPTPPDALESATPALVAKTFYRRAGAALLRPSPRARSPFDPEIFALLGPALLALVLEPVHMAIDTAVVGRLGAAPLGAVGFGTVIFQFVVGLFAAFIVATTTVVAGHAGSEDRRAASRAAAHGMWVALASGLALQAVIWTAAPTLLGALSSSDAEVAGLAAGYLRARSFGLPAALVMMVGIGAARGVRDMAAPLVGSVAYGVALLGLDLALVVGAGAGVEGAGAAAAAAQWVGAVAVAGWLARSGEFDPRDLLEPPRLREAAAPYAVMAPSLAVNNAAALAPLLVATSLATALGPDALAAHSVLRQMSFFWLQAFLAFNATAHSAVASALGGAKRRVGMDRAAGLMERICQLAVASSLPAAAGLFAARAVLPAAFTSNGEVVADVAGVLPLLLVYMPLDALGIALEGGILGAADTRWVASRTAAASGMALVALTAGAATGRGDLLWIWISLKLLNFTALGLDLVRFLGPTLTGRTTTMGGRGSAGLD